MVALLALAIGGAGGYYLGRALRTPGEGRQPTPPGLLTRSELVSLAETLEKNQCYAEAARAWQKAAELAPPAGGERAETLFRIGKNLSLANRHEEALAFLFAAEAADRDGRWKQSVNRLVMEGLSALGREDARAYQAARRMSLAPTTQDAGGRVLADIGGEPITELDLQVFARRMMTSQLAPQQAMMPPDAFARAVESQLERFRTPEGRRQLLDAYISREVLYREALASGQADRKEVQEQINEARRQVLVTAFVEDQIARTVHVGETDVRNHYEAHKADYVEPQAVQVEAIVVDSSEAKKQVSDALDAGTDFAEVRRRHSTTQPADPFDGWIERDGRVPLVTDGKAALAHLFALEKGEVGRKWFEGVGGRWIRFRLKDKRDERQMTLEECRDRVERDLRMRKQQDSVEQLQRSLQTKYKVTMHEDKAEMREGGKAKQ